MRRANRLAKDKFAQGVEIWDLFIDELFGSLPRIERIVERHVRKVIDRHPERNEAAVVHLCHPALVGHASITPPWFMPRM